MFEASGILQIFVTADARYGDRPLYEALFDACRDHDLAGVTVIRDVEGFDRSPAIAETRWFGHEEPVTLIIVDRPEQLGRFIAAVTPWIGQATFIQSSAQTKRVQRLSGGS